MTPEQIGIVRDIIQECARSARKARDAGDEFDGLELFDLASEQFGRADAHDGKVEALEALLLENATLEREHRDLRRGLVEARDALSVDGRNEDYRQACAVLARIPDRSEEGRAITTPTEPQGEKP
jgi:hypothetical protein